jgi:D-alanyl-D-alanine carboxypeptidase
LWISKNQLVAFTSPYRDASPLYDIVGAIGKNLGLEWGGDWTSIIDKPHFQLRTDISLARVRDRFEQGVGIV